MTSEVLLLTTREVAALLRVDPATVRRWAESGDVESVKLPGGQYRFARSVVDGLLSPTSAPSVASSPKATEGVPVSLGAA